MENSVESPEKIRTLIVDDAAFMRRALVTILSKDKEIEIVGVAKHGKDALEAIEVLDPDVITLDVDMPVMDGITAIRHIMVRQPRPVIMVSALAENGRIALEALRLGAVDFFPKPSGTISTDIEHQGDEINTIIKRAAKINRQAIVRARWKKPGENKAAAGGSMPEKILLLWAAGGGCTSFIRFLGNVPVSHQACVIVVQDIRGLALSSFAAELNNHVAWKVVTAEQRTLGGGECLLLAGHNYEIKPGKRNMEVIAQKAAGKNKGARLIKLSKGHKHEIQFIFLSGRSDDDVKFMKSFVENGVSTKILDPKCSVSDWLCDQAVKEGLGPSLPEVQLWKSASVFMRSQKRKSDQAGKKDAF